MLCVECGKREAKYDGLCEECFLKKTKFTHIPEHLTITMCPHCHAIKFGGVWKDIGINEAIEKTVKKNVKLLHELDSYELKIEYGEGDGELRGEVYIYIKYKDLTTTEIHPVVFSIKYQSCPRCDRYFGNYFEAILQIRNIRDYEETDILNYVEGRIKHYEERNRNLFLTRREKRKEGWNLYLSDKKDAKKIAREIVQRYGASLKDSPQIAGRKDGRDVYRVTYSVRLPDYRKGDVVKYDDSYGVVEDIRGTFLKIKDLENYHEKLVDSRRHKIVLVFKQKELKKGVVVYSRKNYVQLLGADNRIIDANIPVKIENGSDIHYFEVDGRVYVVPESSSGYTDKE